jgi:hypothetical protein
MHAIARISLCDRCLHYLEDCDCCRECGGCEVHDYGCGEAVTRERISHVRELVPKLHDEPSPDTERMGLVVLVVDDDASGTECTRRFRRRFRL